MDTKAKKRVRLMQISAIISVAIILILGARTKDFVRAVLSDGDNFEVRLEEDTDVTNHQQVYRLYKNNSYMGDIDYNRYSLLDKIGRTDIRYCVLIEEAKALTYSVLLGAMLIIAIVIAASSIDGTPFTKKNANRIRWIGVLQFGLAIVPGLVGFLMSFFRFEYTSLSFSVTQFYMFAIGVAIMILAQVFNHGVQLQEDVDSIA